MHVLPRTVSGAGSCSDTGLGVGPWNEQGQTSRGRVLARTAGWGAPEWAGHPPPGSGLQRARCQGAVCFPSGSCPAPRRQGSLKPSPVPAHITDSLSTGTGALLHSPLATSRSVRRACREGAKGAGEGGGPQGSCVAPQAHSDTSGLAGSGQGARSGCRESPEAGGAARLLCPECWEGSLARRVLLAGGRVLGSVLTLLSILGPPQLYKREALPCLLLPPPTALQRTTLPGSLREGHCRVGSPRACGAEADGPGMYRAHWGCWNRHTARPPTALGPASHADHAVATSSCPRERRQGLRNQ